MIHVQGYDGGTPTLLLSREVQRTAPDLFQASDTNRADMLVIPRSTDTWGDPETWAASDAWYDLWWGHPTVRIIDDLNGLWPEIDHQPFARAGTLGAPPRIPVQERIAAAPAVSVDHLAPAQIAMYGGRDKLIKDWTAHRDAALARDTSVDAYDWAAAAATLIDRVRSLTPPTLTAAQRAHVATARLLRAQQLVPAARQSLHAHLRNAGDPDLTVRLVEIADRIDPDHRSY